jgi:hypothetical protein
MLVEARRRLRDDRALLGRTDPVVGDGLRPPFPPRTFAEVVVLGNVVGFSGPDAEAILRSVGEQVTPGGKLIVEVAAGPGERSRYLARLPPGAVARLLRSPAPLVEARILREGFVEAPSSRGVHSLFRALDVATAVSWLSPLGFRVVETMSVAPALGQEPDHLTSIQSDAISWGRLLDLEERLGRRPDRWTVAAAVLLCLERSTELAVAPPEQIAKFK